ncbi:olfactory receptor 13-like [Bufo gargarizans]|uniref:olfactory receptor 13-like n=1 Tax=Bufo gargarizans TaxID=30331 RepID=UPI001CF2C00F|nr:olfactory receptor 13-like [Bufo gargarizans]
MNNKTLATEVILLGFTNDVKTNICLFPIFFLIYMFCVFGNSLIICLIILTPSLHTPMYFFLVNLSFVDLSYSSSGIPKLLVDLLSTRKTISVIGCLIQFKAVLLIGVTECQLLAVMAYDRYIAICRPLHYHVLMRWSVCCYLAAFTWIFSFINVTIPSFAMPITLCNPNKINHFMCEVLSVLRLSCYDTSLQELVIFSIGFIVLFLPFGLIIVSYACIISSVLKIHSAGRSKAFSTCTSHITVVAMFLGAFMVTYLRPVTESVNKDKYFFIFCVMISPTLNPLIYSLNNREVKKILAKYILQLNQTLCVSVSCKLPARS